jgi:hypothetical protein
VPSPHLIVTVLVIALCVLAALAIALEIARRRLVARHVPPPSPEREVPRLPWTLALLVRVNGRQLWPSVQIRGGGETGGQAWIQLELVDGHGEVRSRSGQRLPPQAIGTELPLPPFLPPAAASVEEALGWHWDVVISERDVELARWREHPRPSGVLNAEAELA